MSFQDICFCCGSKEDPYLDTLFVVHHPPDAYLGLIIGASISAVAGTLDYSLTGTATQYSALSLIGYMGLVVGFIYYVLRSTSVRFHVLFCQSCRKKYTNRKLIRIAIITAIVLISVVGAVIVSAVMGSDEYIYVPVTLGGIIGVVGLYFKLLSKPRLVNIGTEKSVINIPGIGRVQVDNSWSESSF